LKNVKLQEINSQELISLYIDNKTAISNLSRFISLSEETKNYFFWKGLFYRGKEDNYTFPLTHGRVGQIRELKHSIKVSTHTFKINQNFSCSRANVYRSQLIKVDEKSTNLKRLRSLLSWAEDSDFFFNSLDVIKQYHREEEERKEKEKEEAKKEKAEQERLFKEANLPSFDELREEIIQTSLQGLKKKQLLEVAQKEDLYEVSVYKSHAKTKIIKTIANHLTKKKLDALKSEILSRNNKLTIVTENNLSILL